MNQNNTTVLRGVSFEADEDRAVSDLHRQIAMTDPALVVFFCSPRFDLEKLAAALSRQFACPLIGCTSAGEITAEGYVENSLVGTAFSSRAFRAYPTLIESLGSFDARRAADLAGDLVPRRSDASNEGRFSLLLIDGLSMQEEKLTSQLHSAFGGITLIGGSAGDGLDFEETWVYANGRFARNAAAFCVVETTLPFRAFKMQHFHPTDRKLVVTEADPERRLVTEIDGLPANEAYAEALGIEVADLSPAVFSEHPLILHMGNEDYVRAIQRITPEGGLVFYCAIDNGLVLTIGEGGKLDEVLKSQLEDLKQDLGPFSLILGCDCILRRLESKQKSLLDDVRRVLQPYPFIGFSTYGEQYNGVHVSQTLTGVALGAEPCPRKAAA